MVTMRIDSKHHVRCDSPVAPREKATDPYVNTTGSLTLLSQLEKRMDLHVSSEARPDFPAETPEEPRDPCWHWRGNLMFWPQLQMRTSAPAMTVEESWEAPHNSYRDWTFLRPHEWVPEVPVVTREEPQVSCRSSSKTRRFSPQREMWPFSAAASREKSHLPS